MRTDDQKRHGLIMNLLNVKEVAEIVRVKPSTVYQWAGLGLIPCIKLNGSLRFLKDEIYKWIQNGTKKSEERYNTLAGRRPRIGGKI